MKKFSDFFGSELSPFQAGMRILAGGYLLYLVYQLISLGSLQNNSGWKLALMISAVAAFAVFGLLFLLRGCGALLAMNRPTVDEPEDPADDDTDSIE